MKFSERIGLQPAQILQIDSMDQNLRNSLWNALNVWLFESYEDKLKNANTGLFIAQHLWLYYFKEPLDECPDNWTKTFQIIKNYFFSAKWFEVYDFIEHIADLPFREDNCKNLRDFCNVILEREVSAYRFVGKQIIQITNENEISEIEEALTVQFQGAQLHFTKAVSFLADRQSPDYRNSIKESISGVENICREITGESTLDKALKKLPGKVHINNQLKAGLEKLYHYTNDKDGIRHAIMNDAEVDFEEAKFMLVTCSAFCNYVTGKYTKATLKNV